MNNRPNYITPAGFAALRAEYEQLFAVERPQIVEIVSWAAGNGDRSENGDYLYGRKRMRSTLPAAQPPISTIRSEENTSELQTLMRITYPVLCLNNKKQNPYQ